ncbi:MAG: ribonuclease HI [Eggerthellaceae bacterium]|nr:ribonuclease HI [Eggerthellaceae bacterium]
MQHVELYSDGSSRGNPGPGGYGTILRYTDHAGDVHERELSQGFRETTNNRMELLGAIVGFEAIKRPCRIDFYSDSQYVVKAFTDDWISGWLRRGWKNANKQPVKNVDLWKRLISAVEPHDVTFHWVRGHAGHAENERCDALATAAADSDNLLVDEGYVAE